MTFFKTWAFLKIVSFDGNFFEVFIVVSMKTEVTINITYWLIIPVNEARFGYVLVLKSWKKFKDSEFQKLIEFAIGWGFRIIKLFLI